MGRIKKSMAAAVAVPLFMALLPVGPAFAAQTVPSPIQETTSDDTKVLDLGFEGNLNDMSSVDNEVTQFKGNSSYVHGVAGKALKLDQGALNLGASRKLKPDDMSLSFWWNPSSAMSGEQILMWGKGKYNENGWYLSSNSDTKPLVLSIGVGSGGSGSGQPLEFTLQGKRDDTFPVGTWTHVMVTFDSSSKSAKFYVNGEGKSAQADNTGSEGTIVADDTNTYIGWNGSHNSGGTLTGSLDEVKLWDVVATTADVEREVSVGNKNFDAESLAQTALDTADIPTTATSNLTFNGEAANGSTLTYSSDNQEVISDSGVVSRPAAGEEAASANITVSAAYGSKSVSKTIAVTVPAMAESTPGSTEYLKNYLSQSGMDTVTVSDDYLQNAGHKEIEYLLSFDTDRLLVEFRAQAGLDTKGAKNYGGWENGPSASRNPDGTANPTRFTGHFVGHYISAISQAQRSTFASTEQKQQLAANLKALVGGIREAQEAYAATDAANAGFFPAFPVSAVPNGANGLLVPFYDLHKIEQGMVHAYDYATDDDVRAAAKDAAVDFAKFVVNWKAAHPNVNMLGTEYGGMNDALYQAAEIADLNDKPTVLQAAHLFDETSLFQNLANGKDVLNGLHANTTIPKLIGAMQRYVAYTENDDLYRGLSGDEQEKLTSLYRKAAQNFWDIVVNDHTYANGGNSQSEHFHEADDLWKDATQNGDENGGYRNFSTVETCNEFNMLKLSRLLFQVTKDVKYCEYYEHTFINAIVASQNPETGMTTYFQPMKAGYPKVFGIDGTGLYGSEIGEYWCCQGTGIENFSKLNDSFYFTDNDNTYVNLFISSTFADKRHNLTITQKANVPKQQDVTFSVSGSGSTNLKLRVPEWTSGAKLVVDGAEQNVTAKDEQGWLTVPVAGGTEITYSLPAKLQTIAAADNKNWVAFQYGPVVLAGALNETDPKTNYSYGGVKVRVANYDSDANSKAAIVPTNGESVSEWLNGLEPDATGGNLVRTDKPDDGQELTFAFANVNGDAAGLELHPYYSTYKTSYALYWDLVEVDSDVYQQNILKTKTAAAQADLVIDSVDAFDNEFQQELAHGAAKSEDSSAGTYGGQQYRDAKKDGWFSYDLAVGQDSKNYLSVQYNTADKGRSFDVIVDPTPVADASDGDVSKNAVTTNVTINDKAGSKEFYWDTQELPSDLLAKVKDGKARVLFKSTGGLVGGVYGVRMQRAQALSSNASLKSLAFGSGVLSPKFNASKTSYTLNVPADLDSVDATIGVRDAGSYVTVDGIVIDDAKPRAIALTDAVTTVEIASYAQNHDAVTYYSIRIVKEGTENPVPAAEPVLRYTFDADHDGEGDGKVGGNVTEKSADVSSDSLNDGIAIENTGTAGSDLDGTIVNDGATLVDHGDGKALRLSGGSAGSNSPYVKIPSGVVAQGQKDMTLSAQYAWDGKNDCVYPWGLGKDSKDYLVNIVNCGSNTRVEASKDGTQTQLSGANPVKDVWVTVSVVVKGGKSITYYRDGKVVKQVATSLTAADFIGTSDFAGYLGKSFYNDPYFGGAIDDFKVWNSALTASELFNPDDDSPEEIPVESVTISGENIVDGSLTVDEGQSVSLTASVAPNDASDREVVWSSSDETVATVGTSTGVVTALTVGVATVSATVGGKSDTVQVTVQPAQTPVPPATDAEREPLRDAVAEAGKLNEAEYTADTWRPFAAALKDAKQTLENPNATAAQIVAALNRLDETRNTLVKVDAGETGQQPGAGNPGSGTDAHAGGGSDSGKTKGDGSSSRKNLVSTGSNIAGLAAAIILTICVAGVLALLHRRKA